ncbi:MarC family protein [Fuscovulum blasticum]|uniref:MarC family protein n=1 Tax=Fuscovulum blasticum TaxID=1075 RepID=UPI000D3E87F3|nr:MarC family protein [Fuscovulum blasticum]AWD20552.1 MarC family transcriptional regulator [Fuscovulum blasticum]
MLDSAFLITAFATLFVVIDPPGLVPMFIALTRGKSPAQRRTMARRACLIAAFLLTVFGLAGESILNFVGISMSAFRIAGGILLFLTALDMLFERRTQRREGQTAEPDHDPSVFPLATPLIAGPGAIATMILLVGQAETQSGPDWRGAATVIALMLVMMAVTFAFLLASPPMERLLGRTGTIVITRLLGMLLAALSVQFVIDGIRQTGIVG